jgi:wobble nucleotide-excising tRNase
MADKVPSLITDIQLNDASYRDTNTHIEGLTFVNFFFGNNGTGKSTIAKAIKSDGSGITYGSGRTHGDFLHLVFDQDFIDDHFHSYNNMKGVFTLGAVGKETQDKIDAKEEEKKAARRATDEAKKEQDKRKGAIDSLVDSMAKECWKVTADLRTDFAKALPKKPSMKTFLDTVLSATPKDINLEELRRFYDSAYSDSADRYDEFQPADDCHSLEKVNGLDVLGISVVNTANTDFASFLKRIDATQWVREGHEAYAEAANGVCPYCYRELQDGFETLLAQSFDTQYQENMKKIEDLLVLYKQAANALFIPLSKTPQNVYPKLDKKKYDSKLAAIKNAIQLNIEVISNKKDTPEQIFELQDVATLLTELNDIVAEFNKLIRENNAIVAAQPKKQTECTTDVYSYIAFLLKDKLAAYTKSKADLDDEYKKFGDEAQKQNDLVKTLTDEIKKLNVRNAETDTAKESINRLLRDTGFQGFQLQEKKGSPHIYQVMRDDGTPAANLSEGEKNYIAFLYFYHLVRGSDKPETETRDKIVVIDDPVSSMDSNTLFMVSTLVREMIEVCRNNCTKENQAYEGNYIKQLFILTHNAYFHKEIASAYVSKYEYASYYMIRKWDGHSSIKWCKAQNPDEPSSLMNVNPVKNSYAALWDEYKADLSAVPLVNVVRRILEYYFLQLCGHEGSCLRQQILIDGRPNFVDENGNEDAEKYHIAQTMLAYINANSMATNDDIHFVDDSLDVTECRNTFKLLFEIMGQDQHFNKMMGY